MSGGTLPLIDEGSIATFSSEPLQTWEEFKGFVLHCLGPKFRSCTGFDLRFRERDKGVLGRRSVWYSSRQYFRGHVQKDWGRFGDYNR